MERTAIEAVITSSGPREEPSKMATIPKSKNTFSKY